METGCNHYRRPRKARLKMKPATESDRAVILTAYRVSSLVVIFSECFLFKAYFSYQLISLVSSFYCFLSFI